MGLAALTVTRLLFLGQLPGFHYDEAWAANFAYRIASEPHFWPLGAMSPYTSAWGHYWSALFFYFFGTSLFVYRASCTSLVVLGDLLLSLALFHFKEKKAACLLPWLLAFTPVLFINERFAIDITSFHVFCLGLLAFALSLIHRGSKKNRWASILIPTAIIAGVTSHVLFIGVALSVLYASVINRKSSPLPLSKKLPILLSGVGCLIFFIHIFLSIPEKDKAFFLIVVSVVSLILFFSPACQAFLCPPRRLRALRLAIWLIGAPGWCFLIFFYESSWATLFLTSVITHPLWIGSALVAPTLTLFFWTRAGKEPINPFMVYFLDFWALTVLFTAALAVKPTPRYFEIPLILGVVFFAIILARLPNRLRVGLCLLWLVSGAILLNLNTLAPLRAEAALLPKDQSYHFMFFRDSTADTLNKQWLVEWLGSRGCSYSQIITNDSRLAEELRFLAISDWQVVPTTCPWGANTKIQIGRLSLEAPKAPHEVMGAFWLIGE